MNQGTESADFSHEFNAVQSEEMKAFKANAIAQLSLKAHSKPLIVDVVDTMNAENTVLQQLESLSIKGNTLLEKSEYLMDKLLEISNTGFDLSDATERNKNQINSTNARLEAYQKQADIYKKLLSSTDTVANQRFAAALMKLNDSIQKYELELASLSLSERENQGRLSTWNTLNAEPSITSLSERIQMALIQENQDSLIAVLQRNSNSINQFITYSANLENSPLPIIASNEPLLEELKQLEATENQLSQQIAQIEQRKKTANRKELVALNTDQVSKEQKLNSTRLVIASKMDEITRNDIVNALKINGHEPTDSFVDQLLDRATARKTEQTSLQRVVSAQLSNTTSLDHQRSVIQAETTVIQNQMLLASPNEKEALANKLQELEASLDSINTAMRALINKDITNPVQTNDASTASNTTNPVTNERTTNDVTANPAETNPTAPGTNTTNPITNERTTNDVAANPAETNTTAPGTKTTNPVTNERTTNDVTANPAETNTTTPGTKTTNPVTNERTTNDVAANPAETNSTAPATNTTNPITNERTANDVAVNPTETNTTEPGTNTTNPVTNERTANDIAVNTAETTTTALGTNTTNPVTSERTANDVAVNPTETTTTALGTNTTNPVTSERTANDVAVNPAETNTTAPATNTTNPITNERTANAVAVNPAETNTTAPATNTTNPITNERTANAVTVNPAESATVPVQGIKTEEQQKTENAINEVQELQTALSSLQPEQGGLDNSMSLLKNQLRIAKALLALKTTYGDSTYALIIGEKQGEMLAEALSGSIADLSEISQFETQFSDNAAKIITNGLVVKGLPVKMQPFTPNPSFELTPQQRTKFGSDKSYDDYIGLRKEFVSLASKRNEIEIQIAQKRVALFRAVDDGAIEVISEEMAKLANTLNILEAQELRILSRIERMEDREAYHVLASQGIAPSQNLVYAPLDAQSLAFTLNVDKKQGNRYPILTTLPKGLIFRIQVGVFRNAVPDYFFREFSPVSGERLTDELTAYLTGFFVNSMKANEARGQVRGLGYTDAFVVAYCDGKRIPIKQALEYEKKGLCTLRNQDEVLSEASALLNSKEELTPSTVNIPKEVYYTIQVAALKNQDNGKLNNVPALFYIQSKTGLYKYNSGKFKQLNDAKQQRDALKTLGYTDAYIVAYRDGIAVNFKEIELALAYEQESENLASPTKTAVNTDLSGIELIDPTNVFYAFSKSVDTLFLGQMNAYNRMEAFVYTPDVLRSAPLDAKDISPLLAIYYSDFTLSELNTERVEKMSIQDNSNTFPMVHDFAIRNQIPFRVSYSNEARPCIDFYPASEANRESIRNLAEALSLNVILN
jgi:predicted house-cleaning NTP pyrophosphatase (Maf/HAM1 superfamily)